MIKSIFKDDIKVLPYAKLAKDELILQPIDLKIYRYKNSIIDLAVINKNRIEIIKKNIGSVIIVSKYGITIKFNETFGFNNKLYITTMPINNERDLNTLVVAYKIT